MSRYPCHSVQCTFPSTILESENERAKMTDFENALIWLYVKTWGKFGDHVMKEKAIWHFGDADLETAITSLAYPRKKEKSERIQALTDLIMERFEQGGLNAFRSWSFGIHEEFIETFPAAVQSKSQSQIVKILKWDPGK